MVDPVAELMLGATRFWFSKEYPLATADYGKKFGYDKRVKSLEEILEELRHGPRNLLCDLRSAGLVVLDADDDAATGFLKRQAIESTLVVLTARGEHHYFRNVEGRLKQTRQKFLGMQLDLLVNNQTPLPPDWRDDVESRYTLKVRRVPRPEELPPLPEKLLAMEQRTALSRDTRDNLSRVFAPESYCLRVPSLQGQAGSKGLVRCVCILREAGRSPQQALDFLWNEWNRNPDLVNPPWGMNDILRCIKRHYGLS